MGPGLDSIFSRLPCYLYGSLQFHRVILIIEWSCVFFFHFATRKGRMPRLDAIGVFRLATTLATLCSRLWVVGYAAVCNDVLVFAALFLSVTYLHADAPKGVCVSVLDWCIIPNFPTLSSQYRI